MGARRSVTSGRPISEDEFAGLLWTFERSAFRLEAQPVYAIGEEQAELERFLAGSPRPPSEIGWWKAWLDQAAGLTRQGKRITRIRVIPATGPTDYQRWLMWADPWYSQAGVEIRYLPHGRAEQAGLPAHDWELLDDERLIVMPFTPAGEVGPKELFTDPVTVAEYRLRRSLAVLYSAPSQTSAA
jgi:hypothetical protein